MDAVKKLNENFLSCNICTERFNDPCTLACGHTFCKWCLAEYAKTRKDAIAAKSILCPNCRQMTKVPDPKKPVEDWPKQMKPHFLIQGLLDEFTAAEAAVDKAGAAVGQCYPCQQLGKEAEAGCLCRDCDMALCRDCVKLHETMPDTSKHTYTEVQGRRSGKEQVRHVEIDSAVPNMQTALKQKEESITKTVEQLRTNLAQQKSMLENIGQNKASVQSEIRTVSRHALDLIQQEEKQLMGELDELAEMQTQQLKGQIKSGEKTLQQYQRYTELITQALRSENQKDIHEIYQACQSGPVMSSLDMETNGASPLGKITFVHRLDLATFERNFKLGSVEIKKECLDLTKKPSHCDTFHTRTMGDDTDTNPTPVDVTVLDVDGVETVVVTDDYNKCLKSFYTREGEPRNSTLRLNGKPHTISKLKNKQILVSFYSYHSFLIVQATPDISLHSTINTDKKYNCLTALNSDTLAAGCWSPASIDILDMSGRVQRSVTTPASAKKLIQMPWHLCTTSKGYILASDYLSKSVYCLTPEGDVVFTYRPERDSVLRSITTTHAGDILVVDIDSNKVIQLTERGDFVRDLLTSHDSLIKPHGFCIYQTRLYVTEFDQGTVKVFHF